MKTLVLKKQAKIVPKILVPGNGTSAAKFAKTHKDSCCGSR